MDNKKVEKLAVEMVEMTVVHSDVSTAAHLVDKMVE